MAEPKSSSFVSNEYGIGHVSDELLPPLIHIRTPEFEESNLAGRLQSCTWI
jgi:hypothetical protein